MKLQDFLKHLTYGADPDFNPRKAEDGAASDRRCHSFAARAARLRGRASRHPQARAPAPRPRVLGRRGFRRISNASCPRSPSAPARWRRARTTCSTSAASACGRCASPWPRALGGGFGAGGAPASRSRSSWCTARPCCTTTWSTSATPGAARRPRARSTATRRRSSPATGCWSRPCGASSRAALPGLLDDMLAIIEEMILAESVQLEQRAAACAAARDAYFRIVEGKTAALFRWAMLRRRARRRPRPRALRRARALRRSTSASPSSWSTTCSTSPATPPRTGKALFADLREGKMTYPLILALERAPALLPVLAECAALAPDEVLPGARSTTGAGRPGATGALDDCRALAGATRPRPPAPSRRCRPARARRSHHRRRDHGDEGEIDAAPHIAPDPSVDLDATPQATAAPGRVLDATPQATAAPPASATRTPAAPGTSRFPGFYRRSIRERRTHLERSGYRAGDLGSLPVDAGRPHERERHRPPQPPAGAGAQLRVNGRDGSCRWRSRNHRWWRRVARRGWPGSAVASSAEADTPVMTGAGAARPCARPPAPPRGWGHAAAMLAAGNARDPRMVARGGGCRESRCASRRGRPAGGGALPRRGRRRDGRQPGRHRGRARRAGVATVGGRVACGSSPTCRCRRRARVRGEACAGRGRRRRRSPTARAGQPFAELDPYRAATHNKGVMNGIDAVAVALGRTGARSRPAPTPTRRSRPLPPARHLAPHRARPGRRGSSCRWRSAPSAARPRFTPASRGARARRGVAAPRAGGGDGGRRAGLQPGRAAALAGEGIQRGHMELHRRRLDGAAERASRARPAPEAAEGRPMSDLHPC